MVPLVMSTPKEENLGGGFEDFATHLSLYDDSFSILEKSVPVMADIKGPVPPSILCPSSKNSVDVTGLVKVKRKCGRPRNPIPRHKRESHINAEHRRRGKIQDGFRTLKNIVPKYEQTSGRDSKADILFKAVEYSKLLQNDIKELGSAIEALRAERDMISVDIRNCESQVPDLCSYTADLSVSMDDCYEDYVQQKTRENWTFSTFKAIMHPLFESYKLNVHGESMGELIRSVADWASKALSLSNLRAVCVNAMRNVYRNEPGPYKEDAMLEMNNFRSLGYLGHPLISDNNNNFRSAACLGQSITNNNNNSNTGHHLNNQPFVSEHFALQDIVGCGMGGSGVGTSNLDMFVNTFDNNPIPASSSSINGTHLNMQTRQDPVALSEVNSRCNTTTNNNSSNNIFRDLYYSLDNNLHHQLNLARAGIDRSEHWPPHLYFRQQHWHNYQNSFSPPNYYRKVKKPHPISSNQHSSLSRHLPGDIAPLPLHYLERAHLLSARDFRNDLHTPKEPSDMLLSSVQYYGLSQNLIDHRQGRQKNVSQSSNESEGSLLSIDTFNKHALDTAADNDKYGQLSPSTDSGISPGSSMYVSSPGVLGGRNSDYVFPYPSISSTDHLSVHKHVTLDRVSSIDSQFSLPLPGNMDAVSNRTSDQYRDPMTRFDDMRPMWSTSSVGVETKQALSERFESSSLLGQMLTQTSQTSPTFQTQKIASPVTGMPPSPPHLAPSNNIHNTFSGYSSTSNRMTRHFKSGFPNQEKHENEFSLSTHLRQPDESKPHLSIIESSSELLKNGHQNVQLSNQTNVSQSNNVVGQTTLDSTASSHYNYTWPQNCHISNNIHNMDVERNVDQDECNETTKEICYFEMAHQQLMKESSRSKNRDPKLELVALEKSQKQTYSYNFCLGTEDVSRKTDQPINFLNPATIGEKETNIFKGHPSQLKVTVKQEEISKSGTSKQRARRNSSIECEDVDDALLQSVNDCKKPCHWQQVKQIVKIYE